LLFVERIVTTSTSRGEERIVNHSGTKRGSASGGKGIGSASAKHKGTNNGSSSNTGNHTSCQTSNKTNRESAGSSLFNITPSVVGNVTARNSAVLGNWTHDVKEEATTVRIANGLVAHIGSITHYRSVDARHGQIYGSGITCVDCAQIVVIA